MLFFSRANNDRILFSQGVVEFSLLSPLTGLRQTEYKFELHHAQSVLIFSREKDGRNEDMADRQ
jgi:hypothetical protein